MGPRFNYGKGLYDQLTEVMARLDAMEKTHQEETFQMKEEISTLQKENEHLREENRLLREDNARMKSILNNDSSNTSLPVTRREGNLPILITAAGKRGGNREARRGIKEPP